MEWLTRKSLLLCSILVLLTCHQAALASYAARLCNSGITTCVHVQRGATWDTLFPNTQQRIIAQRLNRMNTRIYPGMVLAIPNARANFMDYAPFAYNIGYTGHRLIIVDPNQLAWGAYDENGDLVRWGAASAGKNYCPDTDERCKTPAGSFSIYRKEGMDCFSTQFPIGEGGAPMPWCMFFHQGIALHGSYQVPGFNASHGCVRIFPEDAYWLNTYFTYGGGTRVIVRPYY